MNEQEYIINEYITLRLEYDKTFIYIQGKKFIQCIRLVLNILPEDIPEYDEINSIDEAAKKYKKYIIENKIVHGEPGILDKNQTHTITPEQEFWGHCSNLQVWVEHGYDSRLLHSNLSFPLLEKLAKVGDPQAKKVFKEEIAKRLEGGCHSVQIYLLKNGYLSFFSFEELKDLYLPDFILVRLKRDWTSVVKIRQYSNKLYRIDDIISNTLNYISRYLNLNDGIISEIDKTYGDIIKNHKLINYISLIGACIFYTMGKENGYTYELLNNISKAFIHFGHRVLPKLIIRDCIKCKLISLDMEKAFHFENS